MKSELEVEKLIFVIIIHCVTVIIVLQFRYTMSKHH